MAKYKNDNFDSILNIFKALSDSSRLRIFISLSGKELCVCQIIELLQLAPSTVSKHLLILKQAGVLKSHKSGRWIYYSISDDLTKEQNSLLNLIRVSLNNDKAVLKDSIRMKEILNLDTELLCKAQSGRLND